MLLFYILHSFLFIKLQHSIYKHVFSSIVKISVDPDQVAFKKPADLDLHSFKNNPGSGWHFLLAEPT